MTKRRIVLFAIGLIVLFTVIYYVLFSGTGKKVEQAAFTAIPLDAALIIETKNFLQMFMKCIVNFCCHL